jgi:multiple sugar transport system substrate-binding protein
MRRHTLAIALSALILVPSGVALGQSASAGPDISGQTINVLMPPWANLPQELLDEFTAETGVKLNYTVAEWDAIRDKIAVAGAAGSELADVTEFDWSWTGQYGRTGWFEPLEGRIDTSDMVNNGAFTLGDHLYGACYNNDYRIYLYNAKMFADAGIAEPPKTFDELLADAKTLKEKGIVEYPLLFPLRAGEDTSMTWYLNVLAQGGQLVDANGQPQFEDPSSGGYKALKFYIDALAAGLIDPAVTAFSSNGQLLDYFLAGKSAITYGAPSDLVAAEDPAASKVVGQIKPMLVPGVSGPGPSYGQPEALGVMSNSQHKDAALAFIDWWEKPETLLKIYDAAGLLPCRQGVLSTLQQEGKLAGGDVLVEELKYVAPLFPGGAPTWYSQFSTEASSLINSAAKGDITVDDAIKQMADTMRSLSGS